MQTTFAPFRFDARHDHALLIAAGYVHEFVPAHWEDVGGPESGPKLWGHQDLDVYLHGNHEIVVEDGWVVQAENVPLGPDGWEDQF